MSPGHTITTAPAERRVQVVAGGETLAESANVVVLHETGLPERYYFPREDVRMDLLVETDTTTNCPFKGDAEYWTAKLGSGELQDVAWSYPAPIPGREDITGRVRFYNDRVEHTFLSEGVLET